jgi:hypothetical protein
MNTYLTLFYTSHNKDYQINLNKHLNNYKKLGFKDIFLYTEECMPKDFEWLYKDFFQKHRRGYGYWAWKPLVIYDSMKKINDGDMILYHDVGRSCYPFEIRYDINNLAKYVKEDHDGIGVAAGGFLHKRFCKRDAFYYMGCDEEKCWNSNQLSATWSFWEKAELPKKFIMDWIKWSFHEKEIITDLPNKCGLPNFSEFEDHRHDQALLTNLIYLYGKDNPKIQPLSANGWEKDINHFIKKYDKEPKLIIQESIKNNNQICNKKVTEKSIFYTPIRDDTTVVTAHFNEDLGWLAQKNYMFKSIVVCNKNGATIISDQIRSKLDCSSCPNTENKGRETWAYLNYIVNNYNNLSQRTAFIHGHENAWHYKNPLSILDAILVAKTDKYGYISLNIKHHPGFDYSEDRNYQYQKTAPLMAKYWQEYFYPYLGEIPKKFSHDCCGQFVVTKDRILKHPKEAYEKWFNLFEVLKDKEKDETSYGYIFEFIWHIIFGESAVVPESQRDLSYFKERFL